MARAHSALLLLAVFLAVAVQGGLAQPWNKCSLVLRTGNGTIPDPYLYDIQVSTPGTYTDVYNPAGSNCGSGEGPSSCLALCNFISNCVKYFVSSCSQPCCSGTSDPMYALGYQNETSACAALEDFDGTGTPSYLDFAGKALLCTRNGGLALGDPHFFGFDGTPFFFDGSDNANFALISEADHQINAKFGSLGPSHGVDSTIWMIGFGIKVRDELSVLLHIDTDPSKIKLFRDDDAKHATKMRVAFPDQEFLHVEVNGAHRDDLLYSGKLLRPSPDVLIYFPPAQAVNPGDAKDGPLAVIKTSKFELTVLKETEDAAHLDLNVKIVGDIKEMHGVLGQTLHWRPEDAASKVKDGDLVEDPKNFELKDGLLGTDFKYKRFKAAAGAEKKAATSRHLLAGKRHAMVEEEVLAVAGAAGAVDYRRVLQQLLPDAVADGPVGRITA